jgi:hypothetical protein
MLIPTRANADSYTYNISSISGTVIASGRVTVAPANGQNKVTVFQGTILNGGFKIDLLGVNSFGNNNNTLTDLSPYLAGGGISFVANGVDYNISYGGLSQGYMLKTTLDPTGTAGTKVSFYVGTGDPPTVTPEPPVILLLATGFAGLMFVFRRKLQLGGG